MGYKFQAEDGSYPYADATGEELNDLRIVTLDKALDYFTSNGDYKYIIEIKNSGDLGKQATDILHEKIRERNLINKVVVGSFLNASYCGCFYTMVILHRFYKRKSEIIWK